MATLRYALRSLRRSLAFTLTVILTLTVGFASMSAMFAVVYGVLLAPLPYGEPDRLVSLRFQAPQAGEIALPIALQVVADRHARTLDGVGFHRTGNTNVWIEGDAHGADSVIGTWVSASMLPLLRVPPLLGRPFTAEEELRSGPEAVILSEAEWRGRFGAAPDVIGKTLMVNSVRRQIVGVMPARFSFPTAATRLWLPAKRSDDASVGDFIYSGVARLAAGADAEQAQRELAALLPRMADAFPRLPSGASTAAWLADTRPAPLVTPLREEMTSGIASTLWLLTAAASLVLMVAWANVANLLLIRADGREPELAVRAALGAGSMRIAAAFLAEAVLLCAAAGAVALALAFAAVRALVAFGPAGIPRLAELGLGLPAVGFTVAITVVGTLVCAAVPAGRWWRTARPLTLREGGRSASAGASRTRVRAAIATLQIAVALVVTIAAALLLRTAHGLSLVRPGFDGTGVVTLRIQLPFARYDETASVAFYARLLERVRELPSVRSAGLATKVPLDSGSLHEQTFQLDHDAGTRTLPVTLVDDGYFAALSIPRLAGRGYRGIELERGSDVVISRRAAETLFGDPAGTASVGKSLALASSGVTYTVVGVVGDVRDHDLATAPAPMVYRPLIVPTDANAEPPTPRNLALLVRSDAPAQVIVPAVRGIVHELDPTVPIYKVETMSQVIAASTSKLQLLRVLITAAAVTTLLLGLVGLYGTMAYLVALRLREFGVRIALGAAPGRIARLVARRGLSLTGAGIAVGFVLYVVAAPLLRAHLFGVTTLDPASLLAATLLLAVAAGFASAIPAWRAARVDPAGALRAE